MYTYMMYFHNVTNVQYLFVLMLQRCCRFWMAPCAHSAGWTIQTLRPCSELLPLFSSGTRVLKWRPDCDVKRLTCLRWLLLPYMFDMHSNICVPFLRCCSSPATILMLNMNIVCFSVLYDCTSSTMYIPVFLQCNSYESCHNILLIYSFEHCWHIHFSCLQDEGTPMLKCEPVT